MFLEFVFVSCYNEKDNTNCTCSPAYIITFCVNRRRKMYCGHAEESAASTNLTTHQSLEPRRDIVIDGMALVKTVKKTDTMKTCKDFAEVFVQRLVHLSMSYDEIRLLFDRYVQGSLKHKMRAKRTGGNEVQYHVDDTINLAKIPLKQFLSHIQIKSELTDYLADKTTDKLQRVLNAAARIVSNTRKYDRGLSQFRRRKLHWLDADDRVRFTVCPGVQVSTQHGAWIPVDTLPTRVQRSWSSSPSYARLVVVNWTFHVSIWLRTGDGRLPMPVPHLGTLPDSLKDINLTLQTFKRHRKTFLFSTYFFYFQRVSGLLQKRAI